MLKCTRPLVVHQGKPLSQTTIGEEEPNVTEDLGDEEDEDKDRTSVDVLHCASGDDPNWKVNKTHGSAS